MVVDPKPGDLPHVQGEVQGNTEWRPEPTHVEKCGDEVWVAEEIPIEPGDSWFSPEIALGLALSVRVLEVEH